MAVFDSAHSVATSAINEIVANAEAQTIFSHLITKNAAQLFDYAKSDERKFFKAELQKALSIGTPDPTVVYRGLLIQLNGVFEGFIKSYVAAHVEATAHAEATFDSLADHLQTAYAAHAGRVLAKIHDGSINGVTYNFTALQESLGSCFSNKSPFQLRGDVFTVLMGNCTPERLEKVFDQVGLPHPFSDDVGRHKAIQLWSGDGKARRAATGAREELSRQIEARNDLVHGLATKAVLITDVRQAAGFFSALIQAYRDVASNAR